MPTRLPQITVPALVASARDAGDQLHSQAAREIARTRAALAGALLSGRIVATVVSTLSHDEITVQAKCKRKMDGRWQLCTLAEADAVYLDVPAAQGPGGYQIGTFYPNGQKAGLFFYSTGVDRSRIEAAKHVLLATVGACERDDEILAGTRCLKCGLELRRKDSILDRIGPECGRKVQAYLNQHQAPGEQFFADVPASDRGPARSEAPPRQRAGFDRPPEQLDAEIAAAPWSATPSPQPSPPVATDAAQNGLISLPAGADPRQILAQLDR